MTGSFVIMSNFHIRHPPIENAPKSVVAVKYGSCSFKYFTSTITSGIFVKLVTKLKSLTRIFLVRSICFCNSAVCWRASAASLFNCADCRESFAISSSDFAASQNSIINPTTKRIADNLFALANRPSISFQSQTISPATPISTNWEALYKSQWLWRKNPEHLTEPEQARLAGIKNKQLATAKAYQMRLVLQDIYRSVDAGAARRRFQVWCRWVRWVTRFYKASLFGPMVKLAQMIERHLAGILAHWKWGLTNAFMEGLNSVFSATKRKARGYRSTIHLITMLYFTAGKLRLPQF